MGTLQFCIPKPAADAVGINDRFRKRLAERGFNHHLEFSTVCTEDAGIRVTCERRIAEALLDELREHAAASPFARVRADCARAAASVVDSFWAAYAVYARRSIKVARPISD